MRRKHKYKIYKRTREQGNYTGKPWLIDFPLGHQAIRSQWGAGSSDGTCSDTFEQCRQFVAHRLNGGYPDICPQVPS